jgi:hypothetical protein
VDFILTDKLLIRYFAFRDTGKKWEYDETVPQLFTDFKKQYDTSYTD